MNNDCPVTYYVAIGAAIIALGVWVVWLFYYLHEKRPQRFKQKQIKERRELRKRMSVNELVAMLPSRFDYRSPPTGFELEHQANMAYAEWREQNRELFPLVFGSVVLTGFHNEVPQFRLPSKLEQIRRTLQ